MSHHAASVFDTDKQLRSDKMQSNIEKLTSVEARVALLRVIARVCLLGAGSA